LHSLQAQTLAPDLGIGDLRHHALGVLGRDLEE
jgi:hypothetical protein